MSRVQVPFPNDLLLAHSDEFTNMEAGPEAGAVGFWFRALRALGAEGAANTWDAIIRAEHYTSVLAHFPGNRTKEQLANQAVLIAYAESLKQKVRDAERAQPGGGESHPI